MRNLLIASALAFSNAGATRALADTCLEDLISEREGMIEIREPWRAETVSSREALRLLGGGGNLTASLNFNRKVEDFWRRKVKRSINPSDLTVRYTVLGGGDRTGNAEHSENDGVTFPVRLISDTPRILCENRDYRIISGGFTMMARVSGVGLAGLYALEIDVDVEER